MGDIRLDDFMRVCTDISLPDGKPAVMRVLSDLELNARRDYTLLASVTITEQLKNPESELYRLKIKPIEDFTLDTMLGIVSEDRVTELIREAKDLYRVDFVPEPEKASSKELIENRISQDKHEKEIATQQATHVMTGLKTYRDKFAELPRETQIAEVRNRAVWVYATSSANDAEVYYTVWCSVERDGEKVWKSVEDVKKLDRRVITKLYEQYKRLDAVDPWEITKSLSERTPTGVGEVSDVGQREGERTDSEPLALAMDLRPDTRAEMGTNTGIGVS